MHIEAFMGCPLHMHGVDGWELVDYVRYRDDQGRDTGDLSYEQQANGDTANVRVFYGRAPDDSQLPRGPW